MIFKYLANKLIKLANISISLSFATKYYITPKVFMIYFFICLE